MGPGRDPVQVRGYRVYVANEKALMFVAVPQRACSTEGVGVPTVSAVADGIGD